MKKILLLSHIAGLTTFTWCIQLHLKSMLVPKTFAWFFKTLAHLINFFNDFQMFLHFLLMELNNFIQNLIVEYRYRDMH